MQIRLAERIDWYEGNYWAVNMCICVRMFDCSCIIYDIYAIVFSGLGQVINIYYMRIIIQ